MGFFLLQINGLMHILKRLWDLMQLNTGVVDCACDMRGCLHVATEKTFGPVIVCSIKLA